MSCACGRGCRRGCSEADALSGSVSRDEEEILDCIDWIAHGFEIVQCPFANWSFTAVDAIAAYAVHGALIVGEPTPVTGIEDCVAKLRSFEVTLFRGGEQQAIGGGAKVLDSPLLAFAHLAEVLADQSLRTRRGRRGRHDRDAHRTPALCTR